jgi:hypothetical protein
VIFPIKRICQKSAKKRGVSFILNIVVGILSIIDGCFLLFFIIKSFLIYTTFRDYLFSIKDEETLNKIRRINPFGRPTFPNTPYTLIELCRELLEKYNQTGDNSYLEFSKKYMRCVIQVGILGGALFMLYVFYHVVV